MLLSILLFLFFGGNPQEAQLRQRVEAFWEALARRDTVAALEYVTPESRNTFLNRNRLPFTKWELLEIKPRGDNEASVNVRVQRRLEGAPGNFDVVTGNKWVFDGKQWMVQFRELTSEEYRSLFSSKDSVAAAERSSLPPQLQVLPELVLFDFLSRTQTSEVVIRNGLDQTASLVSLEVDTEKFEILEKPGQIEPGESANLKLKYVGQENGKELKSELRLEFEQAGERMVITRPILYNHLSPATRALFGLTEEKARNLKRGDPLKPVLPMPKSAAKPKEIPPG